MAFILFGILEEWKVGTMKGWNEGKVGR